MYPWITLGPVIIPTFFIVNTLVAALAFAWTMSRAETNKSNLKFVADLTLVLMVSGLIGARLFHVFYENFDYYRMHPQNILFLWEGGFTFFGGFIFATVSGILFAKIFQQNPMDYFDLYAPVLSLSYALGRIGCFLNGCCYGKVCDLPWSVAGKHPTQLYSTIWELGILFILLGTEKRNNRPAGLIFALWLILHSVGRFLVELLRDDFRGPSWLISISSWISILLFVTGLVWILRISVHKKLK